MGFIRDEDINEVMERNNLVEIISEYVTLKKSGRSYSGLCPFHKEKTPSFYVDPAKQLYHCFGCDRGGNIFSFIMEMEKVEFPEAVKILADRVGYQLKFEKEREGKTSKKERLQLAHQEAVNFYRYSLRQTKEGEVALNYLKKRGFEDNIIDLFQIGYAPSGWDNLTKVLLKKRFTPQELVEAGLSIQGERGYYDRFRERIIFPITDIRGRVVAFGGRALKEEEAKYINSPETLIYHKGSTLYALYLAKNEIVKENEVIVVEGYTDAISLFKEGIKNVVATLGTAFTAEHLRTLSRFTERVILAFDSDTAGLTAAERGLELLGESKSQILVVLLPQGLDPADFISQKGKDEFERIIKKAIPLIEFVLNQRINKHNLNLPEGRIKAVSDLIEVVIALPNKIAQEEYLKWLLDKIPVSEEFLRLEFKRRVRYNKKNIEERKILFTEFVDDPELAAQAKREKEILKILLQVEEVTPLINQELKEDYFTQLIYQSIFSHWKELFKRGSFSRAVEELSKLNEENLQKAISRLMLEEIIADNIEEYAKSLLFKMKEYFLKSQIKKLKKELEGLNPFKDRERVDSLFEEIIHLEAIKRNLQM